MYIYTVLISNLFATFLKIHKIQYWPIIKVKYFQWQRGFIGFRAAHECSDHIHISGEVWRSLVPSANTHVILTVTVLWQRITILLSVARLLADSEWRSRSITASVLTHHGLCLHGVHGVLTHRDGEDGKQGQQDESKGSHQDLAHGFTDSALKKCLSNPSLPPYYLGTWKDKSKKKRKIPF